MSAGDPAPRSAASQARRSVAPKVFWPSATLVVAFVTATVISPGAMSAVISTVQDSIIGNFGWYYTLIVSGFVVFALTMGLGRSGDITLGPDDEAPEFRLSSWFAMLFAAGMGIGLVFWGVAEPLNHFAAPKPGVSGAPDELAQESVVQSFLHWGLHPWAIYVVAGLAIAYAIHRKNRPVSIRWVLEPVLGNRVNGWIGDVIDVAAVVGTLFGVATSLGLGVLQIASGLSFLGLVANPDNWTYIILIGGITALAVFSVVTGVKRGIKWLSNINMVLAAGLLLFVLVAGPTAFILAETVQSVGLYLQNLIQLSFDTTALQGADGQEWQAGWTSFYWGWWISWAPFVGVFIARISRGRTVREFVAGVLVVPTVVTFLWFTVFGGTALHRELFGGGGLIVDDAVDTNGALFGLLSELPAGTALVTGAVMLIVLFFVTSSDSGSLVVDMLASGGDVDPPKWSRVFWAVLEGLVAIALLLAGGLAALQTVSITIALPFSFVMLAMCVATWREFSAERRAYLRIQRKLQQEELTEQVSQNLLGEGWSGPNGDELSRAAAAGGVEDKVSNDRTPS